MKSKFGAAAHFPGKFDEPALQNWAARLSGGLEAGPVSLGLVFMTPGFFPHAAPTLEILRVHGRIPLLIGCSSTSLVINREEIEDAPGLVVALYHLPGADLKGCHFSPEQIEEATSAACWHHETNVAPEACNGWLVFADPFQTDCQSWLNQWNEAYAPLPILGGLASGDPRSQRAQVYLNGEVFEAGGVAVSVGGNIRLASVISQGCTPIGQTGTITRAQGNVILEIGNRPAYEVLMETIDGLSEAEQRMLRGNLFVGLVINEYLEEFHRGDFLIRNLMGADPSVGALVVGAIPRAGQTIQFQRRDARAATEDMSELLARSSRELNGRTIYGGSLHCCNGRGRGLFRKPPRRRNDPGPAGTLHARGLLLQRRAGSGRRQEFSPRLHRVTRVVRRKMNIRRTANGPTDSAIGSGDRIATAYMCAMMLSPNSEHLICVAPSICRAKS